MRGGLGPRSRRRLGWLGLLAPAVIGVVVATGLHFLVTAATPTPTIDDRVAEVGRTLRCPVCQGESVADAPTRLAEDMRAQIRAQLQAGHTPEQVRAYFVARYGDWILLSPTQVWLWLAPAALVLLALAVLAWYLRRRGGDATEALPGLPAESGEGRK